MQSAFFVSVVLKLHHFCLLTLFCLRQAARIRANIYAKIFSEHLGRNQKVLEQRYVFHHVGSVLWPTVLDIKKLTEINVFTFSLKCVSDYSLSFHSGYMEHGALFFFFFLNI